MKKDYKNMDLDQLTRDLLRDTAERPDSRFASLVMERVRKMETAERPVERDWGWTPSLLGLSVCFVGYALALIAGYFWYRSEGGGMEDYWRQILSLLFSLAPVVYAIAFFMLFNQLGRRWERKAR